MVCARCASAYSSTTTEFLRVPMPLISISTTSPGRMFGVAPSAPSQTTSPGESVLYRLILAIDIIGDSVDLLYANLYNPPRQNARVSGRDRTDAQRVCACAASLCCGLCPPLSSRQDLGR